MYIMITLPWYKNQSGPYIVGIVLYIVYLCECAASKTNDFLSNIEHCEKTESMVSQLKSERPLVNFDIANYYNNSKNRRVYTHRANEEYRYFEWLDQTADAGALSYLKFFKCTRLNFKLDFDYTAQSKSSYNYQEWAFKQQNIRGS